MDDDELRELQEILLQNPKTGDVIRRTGGYGNSALPLRGRGKEAAAGSLTLTLPYMRRCITAHSKKEKDNLSETERHEIAMMTLEHGLEEEGGK
jgi:hypothetical protein